MVSGFRAIRGGRLLVDRSERGDRIGLARAYRNSTPEITPAHLRRRRGIVEVDPLAMMGTSATDVDQEGGAARRVACFSRYQAKPSKRRKTATIDCPEQRFLTTGIDTTVAQVRISARAQSPERAPGFVTGLIRART